MREIRSLKKWVDDFNELNQLNEDLGVLLEFQKAP
jgi:hypothetical protein